MAQITVSNAGNSNVIAGTLGSTVSIKQAGQPGAGTLVAFQVFDANGNMLGTIPAGGTYQFQSPNGQPFLPGQVVGQITVSVTGSYVFISTDSAAYARPLSVVSEGGVSSQAVNQFDFGAGLKVNPNPTNPNDALITLQDTCTALAASGAIGLKLGTLYITKAGVAALTLAAPVVGTDDGKVLYIVDTTGHAHTVTSPADGINGVDDTLTFNGTKGSGCVLEAIQGVWYTRGLQGVALSEV